MVFIIGGTLAFFFELLLLSKKDKTLADKLLAIWMLFFGIHLFLFYLTYTEIIFSYPLLLGLVAPFPYLHGPMLFLYTAALTGKIERWRGVYLLHFLPVPLFILSQFRFILSTRQEKMEFAERMIAGEPNLFFRLAYIFLVLAAILYLVFTLRLFRWHRKNLKRNFSYTSEKINLHWLRNLIIGMIFIWMVVIITNFIYSDIRSDVIIYVSVVLFVVGIGYQGLRQGNIFINPPLEAQIATGDRTRYAKSGLKEEEAIKTVEKIEALMLEKKLYLDDSITLSKMAELVDISPNYLSQVLNERFQKNFYDFINGYRIDEFMRLLTDPAKKKYTLLALAYECGFNSKSSFNKYFKSIHGATPSEYLKNFQGS